MFIIVQPFLLWFPTLKRGHKMWSNLKGSTVFPLCTGVNNCTRGRSVENQILNLKSIYISLVSSLHMSLWTWDEDVHTYRICTPHIHYSCLLGLLLSAPSMGNSQVRVWSGEQRKLGEGKNDGWGLQNFMWTFWSKLASSPCKQNWRFQLTSFLISQILHCSLNSSSNKMNVS